MNLSPDAFTPNTRILYVDDEEGLLQSFKSLMRPEEVETHLLQDSSQIEATLTSEGPFALVISDQRMPMVQGVEVLETVRRLSPDTVRVLMAGDSDLDPTLRALNTGGIARYVSKPWQDEELRMLVRENIARHNLVLKNKWLSDQLHMQNEELKELLGGTVAQTVRILGDMVGQVNPDAGGYAGRIKNLGLATLPLLEGITAQERWEIMCALDLFCFGLASLPFSVQVAVNKVGLRGLERFPAAMNHHLMTAAMLEKIPRFDAVARIIRFQERDFDGQGEPKGDTTRGFDIPLGARLFHILIDLQRRTTPNFKGRDVLAKMKLEPRKYDAGIIERMLTGRTDTPGGVKKISLEELKPGMALVHDVLTQSGQCLLRSTAVLTSTSIGTIYEWNRKDPVFLPIDVIVEG